MSLERINYPRVSDIMSRYSRDEYLNIPLEILAKACERGIKVEEYAVAYMQGAFLPDIEEEYTPYIDAFKEWADKNVMQLKDHKKRLYDDKKRFSGEFDFICKMKDGTEAALIDLKCTSATSKSWPIQLAAYDHLCKVNGLPVQKVMNLHILKKRKQKNGEVYFTHEANEIHYKSKDYIKYFFNALENYDYFDRKENDYA